MDSTIKTTDKRFQIMQTQLTMETIQKISEKWMTVITIVCLAIMVAWMFYYGIMLHPKHTVTLPTVTSTTIQWASDTTWGGWR